MANSDASLIFDASLDYEVSFKRISKQLVRIINNIEKSGGTKIRFDVDETSIKQIEQTLSGLSVGFQNPNISKAIQKAFKAENISIPTQFVADKGQSIESFIGNLQNQIGKIANQPVKIRTIIKENDDGELQTTKATVEYLNKDLGITEQRIYAIEKAEEGLVAKLKQINMLEKDTSADVYVSNIDSKLATYQETIKKFSKITNPSKGNHSYSDVANTVKAMEEEVKAFKSTTASAEQKREAYRQLTELSETYSRQVQNLNSQMHNDASHHKNTVKLSNLQSEVQKIWNQHNDEIWINTDIYEKFQKVQEKLKHGIGEGGYSSVYEASESVAELKKELNEANIYTDSLGVSLKNLFDVHLKTQLTMAAIHLLSDGFNQMIEDVKAVNSALTQLEIVTGENGYSIERFADKAFKAAQKIGASATDIMSSTETWARLGYSLNESLDLAKITAMFANVGDISVDDATTSMTSILKAYTGTLDVSDAERIADILVDVGAKYAVSAGGLGEALQRGGASLEAANNSLEESIALITAGNASVQDEASVGNALKTISMRIRGATAELEDAGEEIDKYCESTATMQKEIKALSGVEILEADGETFRSTYDIMVDIAKVYNELADKNKASLLEALAGKRNASVVKSIITNIDDLTGSYKTAQNAIGAVDKANSTYLDSIEGRIAQLSSRFQEFSNQLISADWFKNIISGLTGLFSILQTVLTFGDGIIAKILGLITVTQLLSSLKIGKIMPSIPKYKSNGRVSKLVNSWEVYTEYYNYKVA